MAKGGIVGSLLGGDDDRVRPRSPRQHHPTPTSRSRHRGYGLQAVTALAVRILGPLQVAVDDTDFTPSAPKERALLAQLLLEPGRTVAADRLADDLWPKLAPDRSRHVLQVRIATLRKLLDDMPGDAVLRSSAGGYRIEAPGVELDAELFAKLAAAGRVHARAGDAARADRVLREALDLWRGDALMDVQLGSSLEGVARRLDADRLAASVDLLDVELQLGQHHERLPELEQLGKLHPFDERVWALHALALYRGGRQVEALRTCRTVRHRLVEDIGVVPGPALRQLKSDLLAQRPELDFQAGETGPAATATMAERVAMPTVHYARSGDGTHLAYQVAGDGPLDLIVVPGLASHLETWWEAATGRLVRRLASFSRLIIYDKRGTGLSDRPANIDAEQWVDDIDVVLDAVGCERAAILAVSAGGPIGARYAARHPERVAALVLRRVRPGAVGRGLPDRSGSQGLRDDHGRNRGHMGPARPGRPGVRYGRRARLVLPERRIQRVGTRAVGPLPTNGCQPRGSPRLRLGCHRPRRSR